jgi:hypothetical protein
MMRNANMTTIIMETNLGIFRFVRKSIIGKRMKERKMAKKKGKRTGLACCRTTPARKMTMMTRQATTTLFSFMGFFLGHIHYNPFGNEIKTLPSLTHL